MMPRIFSADEKATCIERELRLRERVYARRVEENKMTVAKASYEIACMKAILDDYKALAENDRLL
jgi:hypothetical protein